MKDWRMKGIMGPVLCLSVAAVLGVGALTQVHAQPRGNVAEATAPIPEGNIDSLIKQARLVESDKTVKELVPGWTKPKMMLVAIDRPDRLAWLQEAVPGVKLIGVTQRGTVAQNEAEAMPYIADADAILHVHDKILCTANLIKAAKKLKWIHHDAAGPDSCALLPDVAAGKFLMTDSKGLRDTLISENAIADMVALMRGIDVFARMDVAQHVDRAAFGNRGWRIEGRTLLVVGLGGIGTDIARKAHALGMKVIATRATSHEGPDYVDYVGLSNELPDLIGKADVVIMAAPLTPETTNMFNAALFARMKRGSIFVNVARGEQVVQDDLAAALKSGQLGAAALDVTVPEPLPDHDPLYSAPNILITSHAGAPAHLDNGELGTQADGENIWLVTRENMRRYAAGEKMLSVVDLKRGY